MHPAAARVGKLAELVGIRALELRKTAVLQDLGGQRVLLGEALPGARLFVVQSAGGMVPTAAAAALPVATVMSGR